ARGPSRHGIFGHLVALEGGRTVVADETYIRESILRPNAKIVAGYQPIMPTFEGQVSEEQLTQLVAYVKSLSTAAPEGTGAPGQAGAPSATGATPGTNVSTQANGPTSTPGSKGQQ
nr:cytochrome c [Acidobacteriota bacterium]